VRTPPNKAPPCAQILTLITQILILRHFTAAALPYAQALVPWRSPDFAGREQQGATADLRATTAATADLRATTANGSDVADLWQTTTALAGWSGGNGVNACRRDHKQRMITFSILLCKKLIWMESRLSFHFKKRRLPRIIVLLSS
jgi:hypothetical protein